jgi:hypothetical protein
VFVSTTVLLETEWVLRSVYGFAAGQVAEALRAFVGLPRVALEDSALVAAALERVSAASSVSWPGPKRRPCLLRHGVTIRLGCSAPAATASHLSAARPTCRSARGARKFTPG